jgi:hypothetical protein
LSIRTDVKSTNTASTPHTVAGKAAEQEKRQKNAGESMIRRHFAFALMQ